jgi:hypothetical protein
MKTRLFAGLVALLVLAAAFAVSADAATTNGKVSGFSYKASTKGGRLAVVKSGHKTIYRVTAKTNCGVSQGQSGDQIACKSLGKDKYHGKPVSVTWTRNSKGDRIASLVAVHL